MHKYLQFLINFLIAVIFCLSFTDCGLLNKQKSTEYSVYDVQNYLDQAIRGNKTSNSLLKNIIDSSFTLPIIFEQIKIDSINLNNNKIFTIVLQHKNPFYNRFALYDKDLNLLLIDKSLNGVTELKNYFKENALNIEVKDAFVSKDSAIISRLSIYRQKESTFALVYRAYTKLILPDNTYTQDIVSSVKDSVSTVIISAKDGEIGRDVFLYDNSMNKYVSSGNTFEKIVLTEVSNLLIQPQKPQLIYDLARRADEIDDPSYFFQMNHFLINVEKGWTLFKNYNASGNLKKSLTGFKYINDSLNSSIFIAPLAGNDKTENYVTSKLSNKSKGKYTVFFSDAIEDNNTVVRYFEYTCANRKFLLMIQINKSIFKTSKKYFEDIINSFVIDC
ncbi:MAG: hypothetical protein Q8903_01960 [Bacteroidota bacterium]|nr:hypothetical protein [Bacteroidota bacterium]